MTNDLNDTDSRQLIEKLARQGQQQSETVTSVISPGARAAAWTVKIKSLDSYNVYNIRNVVIGDAGSLPVEIGTQTKAVNLAESFIQAGQLSAGTYAIMFRVADKNVFYVKV